jgi:diguanylate cyclase (GGDEF)-like protein/PAS domain S-box-containing protein
MLIVITSVGIASLLAYHEIKEHYNELLVHGKSFAELIAENSEYAIFTEDRETLRTLVNSIDADEQISYVFVLDEQRKVLQFKSKSPSIQSPPFALRAGNAEIDDELIYEEYRNKEDGNRYIDIFVPVMSIASEDHVELFLNDTIELQSENIGFVQLGYNLKGLQAYIRKLILTTILFTVFFIMVGSYMTFFMTGKITSPVKKLALITQEISEGKLDHTLEINTNDEIADLSHSFNHMLDHLKNYKNQVESRTHELSEANQQMLKEIAERKMAETSLAATKTRLQYLLDSTPAVIYSCKPYGDYAITFLSDNINKLLGYEANEFRGISERWTDHVHKDDLPRVLTEIPRIFESGYHSYEYRFRNKNGDYTWILNEMKLMYDEEGSPSEIVGYWMDIGKRKLLEEQLRYDAFHDALTQLPNRTLFLDHLEIEFARATRRENYIFAVLFLDMDRFKNINDSLGHLTGDKLLIAIGERLKKSLHSDDTVARLGGDEFAVLLSDIRSVEDSKKIAERLLNELRFPFYIENQEIFISASIGIVLKNRDHEMTAQMLRDADIAMYHAKALGGASYVFFDKYMHVRAVTRLKMENDLRRAMEENEFFVNYQPIGDVQTENIIGFEALLRWRHPEYGLVSPMDFIPIAEETGLIVPIGKWVLQESCLQMSKWQAQFPSDEPFTISVNLSVKQFRPTMIDEIKSILENTNLHAGSLRLEITETVLMEQIEMFETMIKQLSSMNVHIHIDDFGTGYSSLNYLHKFDVTSLKIDRSFIKSIDSDADSFELVKTIRNLARNLNMSVIAEGVETIGQLEQLKKIKCDYMQGYLLSKPLECAAVETFLAEKKAHTAATN